MPEDKTVEGIGALLPSNRAETGSVVEEISPAEVCNQADHNETPKISEVLAADGVRQSRDYSNVCIFMSPEINDCDKLLLIKSHFRLNKKYEIQP